MNGRSLSAALAGAVGISFSAIFFRLADVSPVTGGFFRMVYALPVLIVAWRWAKEDDRRTVQDRRLAAIAGGLLGIDIILWQTSITMIGAGLATLITNSQVVIVPLATWWLFGERPARRALLAMPVVAVGLSLITGLGRPGTFGENPVLGVALSVGAACFYTGFLIVFRRSNRMGLSVGPLLDAVIGSLVVLAVAGLFLGDLELRPSWPAHGWLLALALVSQVVGWLLITYALPRLPAAHTSFAILLQPSLTIVWGRIIFDERASVLQSVGVVLVLMGIAAATMRLAPRRVAT